MRETENIMQDSINKVAKMMEANMERTLKPQIIEKLIANELEDANKKFPAFASVHEGYAVLKEEVEESREQLDLIEDHLKHLWRHTRNHKYPGIMMNGFFDVEAPAIKKCAIEGINELIQVAAMCDKFKALTGIEEERQQKLKEYAAAALKPEINLVHDNLEKKYDTGSPLSMRTFGPESMDRRCDNCNSYYLTPAHGNPICLNQKNQKAETRSHWKCPEWEPKGIEKRTPSGDPLNMKETLAEKGAMSHEELEAFNKNNLSQKLKNRCRDCTKFVGDIFCATNTVRVDADWTCGAWTGKGE